ncbi:NEDD4-binding protein 2 [Ochlerotatus camptorhynchus]|uniref:NEDD4-binding protein 2 n=1 Tax=Ochlerotatus camptorhynchus TaxID=644619 RepID=UPI0031CEFA9A
MLGDEILAQLTEMFGDYIDQTRIQNTVKRCNNDLEACIEMLLKDEDETVDDSPKFLQVQSEDSWDMLLNSESSQNAMLQQPLPAASTGAIKKISTQQPTANESLSFASFLHKGSTPQGFGSLPQPQRSSNMIRRGDKWPSNFDSVVDLINRGYRVMVLMRGAPGSGKSYLSRALIDKTLGNGDYRNHVFSADDYFIVNGVYRYQADRIEDAHRFNQNNVLAKARDGWSPIVVDNTHMKLWEMFAYVQIAADNGYHLEVLEPVTHWRFNSRSLASRNTHGVPEGKIKAMLTNYEKLKDTTELYKQCKLEHALYLPQKMRHFPILKQDLQLNIDENQNRYQKQTTEPSSLDTAMKEWSTTDWEASNDSQTKSTHGEADADDNAIDLANIPIPKPPRLATPKHTTIVSTNSSSSMADDQDSNQQVLAVQTDVEGDPEWCWPTTNEISWKPYDKESIDFWTQSDPTGGAQRLVKTPETPQPKRADQLQAPTSFLLSSIKIPAEWKTPENSAGVTPVKPSEKKKSEKKRIALVRHRRGCKNENTSFSEICILYPQIPVQYLWDLFENCNGDGDWTANLLLEEQKTYEFEAADNAEAGAVGGPLAFECDCNETMVSQVPSGDPSGSGGGGGGGGYETDRSTVSSESPRNTTKRKDKALSEDLQNAKKQLEAFVVLGKEHYSKHIQQIRASKGIISKEEADRKSVESETFSTEDPIKSDPEVLEVTLGINLISQLHATFKDKHGSGAISLDELTNERTKVFMATEMAEQLYLSFLDSIYSCREENKIYTMKKDARLAQQMEAKEKYPVLFKKTTEDSPNLNDIMEMEYALTAYRSEINGWAKQAPQDLASHMTRQKLAEMYPSVDGKVLAEILHAHHNKFSDTITVLNNSIPEELRNQIAREREALLKRAEAEKQKPLPPSSTSPPPTVDQGPSSSEDDINLHLKTAEECRNLSQHHQELKNECHEKARNAIQRGMAGVAEYYAQVARLHRTKIDMYSSKASNAIMEVHKLTLNNVDVLDLHYLHSEEALRCLEIFLAEHARKLTHRRQQFKELFIITGRGLHSADGIPIIKHRVKAMLRDLGLRCVELNPGFLKIKLHNNPDMLDRLLAS